MKLPLVGSKLLTFTGLCLVLGSLTCSAKGPLSSFDGQWKINWRMSDLELAVSTYAPVKGSDEIRFTQGDISERFKQDGKDYPTDTGRTVSQKQVDATHWKYTYKKDGKIVTIGTLTLSADGKMLSEVEILPRDGRQYTTRTINFRISEGSGLFGTWRTRMVYHGNYLGFDFDDAKEGVDYPTTWPGYSVALKKTGFRKAEATLKVNGEIRYKADWSLSEDSKTLIVEYTEPGARDKSVLVYEKQ